MKFLISTSLSSFRAMTNMSSYIHLCDSSSDISAQLTSPETVDVWICNGEEVTSELVDRWLSQACHTPKSMLVEDTTSIPRLQEYTKGHAVAITGFTEQGHTTIPWEESILQDAETLYAHAHAHAQYTRTPRGTL